MHQLFSDRLIGAHREGELALSSGETTGFLDEPMPKGIEFLKCQGGSFVFPSLFLSKFRQLAIFLYVHAH